MENRARLIAKNAYTRHPKISLLKRGGLGVGFFEGAKGEQSKAGVLGQFPYRICVRANRGL